MRETWLDLCQLLIDLSVLPLRMPHVLVAYLICVGEILHVIAQVRKLAILRFTSCLKVVALDYEELSLFCVSRRSFSSVSIFPFSCAKSGDGMIGVALPRVATLRVSALFRRSCATSRWS